jgi:hypothetical protein
MVVCQTVIRLVLFCVSFLCNMQLRIAYHTFPSCFLLYKWATPRRKKDGRLRRIWRRPPHLPSNRLAAPVLLHRRSVVKTANKIIYNNKENIHQMEMKPLGAARQPCCRFSSNWPIASFLFLVLLYIYTRIHNSGMFLCLWFVCFFVCFFWPIFQPDVFISNQISKAVDTALYTCNVFIFSSSWKCFPNTFTACRSGWRISVQFCIQLALSSFCRLFHIHKFRTCYISSTRVCSVYLSPTSCISYCYVMHNIKSMRNTKKNNKKLRRL